MITPAKLFKKRIVSDWKFQYKVWRMAIDWTVALYIVIPAIILGIYQCSKCRPRYMMPSSRPVS